MTTLESSPPNVLSRTIPLAFVGHFSAYKSSRLECAEQIFAEANKNSAAFSLLGAAVTPSYHKQTLPHSVNRRDAIKPQESPIKSTLPKLHTLAARSAQVTENVLCHHLLLLLLWGIYSGASIEIASYPCRGAEHFSFARIMRNGAFFMALASFHRICYPT